MTTITIKIFMTMEGRVQADFFAQSDGPVLEPEAMVAQRIVEAIAHSSAGKLTEYTTVIREFPDA